MKSNSLLAALVTGALALSATTLLSCGGSTGATPFVSKNTKFAAQGAGPLQMGRVGRRGRRLRYRDTGERT